MAFRVSEQTRRRNLRAADDEYNTRCRGDDDAAEDVFSTALLRTRYGSRMQRRAAWQQLFKVMQRLELDRD
jgi:hypothetical protein